LTTSRQEAGPHGPVSADAAVVAAAAAVLLSALLLAATTPAHASSPVPSALVWATDAEGGAPYIYKDPKDPGHDIGFEVDIVREIEKEIGRPIVSRQYAFSSLILGVQRGDFDFAMNGLEVTPDREAMVLFSRPYYLYREQLVVRKAERRFSDLEGAKRIGAVVGTLEDTAADRLLSAKGVRGKMYDGVVEPYRDLALGRLDAVLLDLGQRQRIDAGRTPVLAHPPPRLPEDVTPPDAVIQLVETALRGPLGTCP
jgi:ABC-type amino acid transport substrate-binding protein